MTGSESSQDTELGFGEDSYLFNSEVRHFAWSGVNVTAKDASDKDRRKIVSDASGLVKAGEVCALMGPSGCGKTTLLAVLARKRLKAGSVESNMTINGNNVSTSAFRQVTRFVEQEDALLGSLTVRETLDFSSRLASSRHLRNRERHNRVSSLLDSFGLQEQAGNIVGTPLRKGISGGQKRRLSVASQLITSPRILLLDEPTSGLDSFASWEIIKYITAVAKAQQLIVILSIHQPSASILEQFDKLLLLASDGKSHYFGPVDRVAAFYSSIGHEIPQSRNEAEYLLELLNSDFAPDKTAAEKRLRELQEAWQRSRQRTELQGAIQGARNAPEKVSVIGASGDRPSAFSVTSTLLRRGFIKSYRDPLVYGVRLAIYAALAIMMGTVWLRLKPIQTSIQPFTNALFFGSVFISFLAVTYVPALLEDLMQYAQDHQNGLYGATEFVMCNFLLGLPFIFILALVFASLVYWLAGFEPTATAFFTFTMWLFLELLAAESVVLLATCAFPTFVVSLAATALANGLWISVSGFMVPLDSLNAFYKYGFAYWNYQKYAFEGMMVNEFRDRVYSCGQSCHCMYESALADRCEIAGKAVLDQYGFKTGNTWRNVGITVAIVALYRIAAWLLLTLKR